MARITWDDRVAFAAAQLGMKRREVVDLIGVPEGTVAVTHDGQQTLIPNDGGRPRRYVRPPLGAEPAEPAAPPAEDPVINPDLDALRAEAEALGVKVDKRWAADRLAKEIEARKGSGA